MNQKELMDQSCESKFSPGIVFISRGVYSTIPSDEVGEALVSHLQGDWGDVSDEDRIKNDAAVAEGGFLFSIYRDRLGVKFWIATKDDRSETIIFMDEEA